MAFECPQCAQEIKITLTDMAVGAVGLINLLSNPKEGVVGIGSKRSGSCPKCHRYFAQCPFCFSANRVSPTQTYTKV